jgi:hypothetical protein
MMDDEEVGVVGGINDFKKINKLSAQFIPAWGISSKVVQFFKTDPLLEKIKTERFIDYIASRLVRKGVEYIILPNDSLFLERFLILCARKANITSICIQHGLFNEESPPDVLDGHCADYMFLWGESQKEIYAKNKSYEMGKIRILGYPYKKNQINDVALDKTKICIFGQPWEVYDKSLGEKKKIIFENVIQNLSSNGVSAIYKPHPGEKDQEYFPEGVEIYKKDINCALQEYDVFISLTSTALLEASLNGKIAIQLFDKDFKSDHYAQKGYSYTFENSNYDNIYDFIMSIQSPFDVPNDVIYQSDNLKKHFLSLIKEC